MLFGDRDAWWAGNTVALLGFFVACIGGGFFFMMPLKGRRHPDWKGVDLAVVLVGTVGLLGLTFQSDLTATQLEAPYRKAGKEYLRFWMSRLIEQADLSCVPHPRIAGSPPNNEDIEQDRRLLCEWATANFKTRAARIVQGEDEMFDADRWPPFPKLKTGVGAAIPYQGDGKWFWDAAHSWDDGLTVIKRASDPAAQNQAYLALIFLSPYILAVAIAVQIVKIFYEKRE
jgi:hypothetical protein